jgi:hypothetical protein
LEAHRKDEWPTTYTLNMHIRFLSSQMSIIDILALFNTFSIPIFKFELWKSDWKTVAIIQGEISNPAKIWFLLADLRQNHPWIEIISKDLK